MNFAIKLLHEARHGNIRRVYGYSGGLYLFRWRHEAKSYVYQPGAQAEVDDLFKAQGRTTQLYFAPVDAGAATAAETATPPLAELPHDTEQAIRMLYEAAMMRVGLVPTTVPEAGYFDAQQLEQHVTTFLNRLAAPPVAKKVATKAPKPEALAATP